MTNGPSRLDEPVSFPKWGTDAWHDFLVLSDATYCHHADPTHPFERVIHLREAIETEVPDTVTTFNLAQYAPENNARPYTDEMLALCGTWRVPSELTTTNGTRVVNPNNPNAHVYSDAVTICECGHPVRRLKVSNADPPRLPGRGEHAPDCTTAMRARAREELAATRRRLFDTLAPLCLPTAALRQRFGYTDDYGHFAEALAAAGVTDYNAARQDGRRQLLRTLLVLLRVHSPETVGRIYGFHTGTIGNLVRDETTADPDALFAVRRRAQSENFDRPLGFVWKPTRSNRARGFPAPATSEPTARTDGGTD